MKLYHATPGDTFAAIMDEGLKVGQEGCIFLAESEKLSHAFMLLYGIKNFVVFEVDIPESDVEISDDHNEEYFIEATKEKTAKCYMTDKDIPRKQIKLINGYKYK